MSIEKFRSYSVRKTIEWQPEGADFTIEFREPSGAFLLGVEEKYAKKDKKGKVKKDKKGNAEASDRDNLKVGFALVSETVYIDDERTFETVKDVESYLVEEKGSNLMIDIMERASEVCGRKKKGDPKDKDEPESEQEKN